MISLLGNITPFLLQSHSQNSNREFSQTKSIVKLVAFSYKTT